MLRCLIDERKYESLNVFIAEISLGFPDIVILYKDSDNIIEINKLFSLSDECSV